jgi:integrase/recombinase XerD
MSSFPCLARFVSGSGQVRYRLGDRLVDRYLEFVAGRCRPNTLRAVGFDLKAFFTVISKDPVAVTAADVFEFLAHQRGDRTVVRLADRESGLSARTIARRLSSVSGLYAYLVARGDTPVQVNPVPRGLLTRRAGGSRRSRTAPLVRVPRTLPRILSPGEADRLVGALRTHRDRAMVLGMLLAGLRRCEVLGLRFCDVQVADRRLVVVEGKGGHHRVVPVANRFFDALGSYLHDERPEAARTDRVFVVLKGPRRGLPLSAEGLDEILAGARRRAGLDHATCHELRHTCLTRLQRRGVASDATFRVRREDGAVRASGPGTARWRSRRQSEPAGQDRRDRTVLRQMPGCCVHSGCIRRKHDAAKATKKRGDEGRCHYRPVVTLTHSAGLVNRSLPVGKRAWLWRRCRPRPGT